MARRSLRPELNRIRAWVRQGRTDAWIAHQFDVTVQQIAGLQARAGIWSPARSQTARRATNEIDLRAEDDALIAAELDAAEAEAEKASDSDDDESDDDDDKPKRRRGRRGGRRGRRKASTPLEATFDHGDEGYGLWLDPAVQDDPTYAEYWAGHRPVEVVIEEDQIIIRRAGADESDDNSDDDNGNDNDNDD